MTAPVALHRLTDTDLLAPASSEAERVQPASPLSAVTFDELHAMHLPPREMILAPVLPMQGSLLVHGPTGGGKTWAVGSMVAAIVTGTRIFERWESPKPRRVLLVDGEMPANLLRDRLAAVLRDRPCGMPEPDFLRIIAADLQGGAMPDLSTDAGRARLAPHLDGIDVIVLDNLATLFTGGVSNDAVDWAKAQGWILEQRRLGRSTILVHHDGKAGEQLGSEAKKFILDTVIALKKPPGHDQTHGARFIVHLDKARGIFGKAAADFEARLVMLAEPEGDRASWDVSDSREEEQRQIIELTKAGLSIRKIMAELGVTKARVEWAQNKAREEGLLDEHP
jgi:putative DNA primase/helicase